MNVALEFGVAARTHSTNCTTANEVIRIDPRLETPTPLCRSPKLPPPPDVEPASSGSSEEDVVICCQGENGSNNSSNSKHLALHNIKASTSKDIMESNNPAKKTRTDSEHLYVPLLTDDTFCKVDSLDDFPKFNKRKRTVRFASEQELTSVACHIPTLQELSLSERLACWWREEDFYFFKKAARRQCREVRRRNDAVLQNFEHAGYCDAKFLALTREEHEIEALLASPTLYSQSMTDWTTRLSSIRGLEHWTAQQHASCRHEVMQECLQVVTELSRFCETAAEIAKQSREYSRASRIVARWLGQADAVAAAQVDEEGEEEEELVCSMPGKSKSQGKKTGGASSSNNIKKSPKNGTSSSNGKIGGRFSRRRGSASSLTCCTAPESVTENTSKSSERREVVPSSPPSPFSVLPRMARRRRASTGGHDVAMPASSLVPPVGASRRRSTGGPELVIAASPGRKFGLRPKLFR